MTKKPLKPAWDWPDYGSAADRDRERAPGMTDEWTDDDPPKEKTKRAIAGLEAGKGTKFSGVDDLMADLNASD